MRIVSRWSMFFAASSALCGSTEVHASGFALLEQSASRLGTAFAGAGSVADDATSMQYNPAAIAFLERAEFAATLSDIGVSSEFNDRNSQAALGQTLGNSGGDAGEWSPVPSAFVTWKATEAVGFGLGVSAPFGLKLEYDNDWMGRFQASKSEIKTYNFNPAVSYRISKAVAIGVGVDYQKIQADFTNDVNYTAAVAQGLQQLGAAGQLNPALIPGLIAANAGLQGTASVRGDDSAWGFNLGVLFEPALGTRIGVSYRSAIKYTIEGSARFTPPAATNSTGAAIINAASAPSGALATGAAAVDLKLPASALVSFSQRVGSVDLLADVSWTQWSSIQELRVLRPTGETISATPERWRDTWRYALGAAYSLNDAWTVRAGIGYDEAPVPDATRTPRLPDTDRRWLAAGVRWSDRHALRVDVGYARLFSSDVPLNQNEGSTAAYGWLNGEQASAINIVSAQLSYGF